MQGWHAVYGVVQMILQQRELKHNSGKGSKYVAAHGGGKIVYHGKIPVLGKDFKTRSGGKKIVADR